MDEFKAESTPRRGFLARLAAGSLAFVAGGQATTHANSSPHASVPVEKAEPWLLRIKGKHRQIFDAMEINSGFPLVMTHIWLMTNKSAYNLSPKELSAVLVLRHGAIAICMNDAVWAKYKLGEIFNVTDPVTNKPAERNIYAATKGFALPPMAEAAMDNLKSRGVILCGCNMALMHFSEVAAEKIGAPKGSTLQEWMKGLLPGVTLVPSGVLAVGRAQESGCTYCNVT